MEAVDEQKSVAEQVICHDYNSINKICPTSAES